MSANMPKAPEGFAFGGGNRNSMGEDFYGHVNVSPPRFVDERPSYWLNMHESNARSLARGADGQGKRGPNETQGR